MMNFSASMSLAMSVFYRVASLLDEANSPLITAEAYQNGREQGLCIWNLLHKREESCAYFAKDRHSDDIVVYLGENSFQSISSSHYQTKRCFKTVDDAANYIIENLNLNQAYPFCRTNNLANKGFDPLTKFPND